MTAVQESLTSVARARPLHIAAPAIISVTTLVVLTIVVDRGWGQPDLFNSEGAYRAVLNAAVLLRLGPAFLSAIVVYPAMRLRGAPVIWAGLGAVSSAFAFGILASLQALTFFPPAQAAYYAINPMVVAAIGSQVGWSALGEVFVRWRRGGRSALASPRLWAVVVPVAVIGFTFFYVGVIWDGGRHWFYIWIRGFMLLFGTGQ